MRFPRPLVLLLLGLAAVVAFGLLDVRQRARTDRGAKAHRTDVTVYLAAADALARGDDPYLATSPRGWRYVYPPLLALAFRPLLRLSTPDAAFVWYLLGVVALALALRWTLRDAEGVSGRGRAAGAAAVAAATVVALLFVGQTFQRGQVTTVLLALQVGAFALLCARREVLAGVVLAAGVALRLTPLLPAGVVAIGALRRLVRGEGRSALRFPAGLLAGLVLWFGVVPVACLGPDRAREVTARWLEVTRAVYAADPGASADLAGEYGIEEFTFKNQGVRRIAATAVGVAEGLPFERERPRLPDGGVSADRVALAVALAVLLGAVVVGWTRCSDPTAPGARLAYAAACLAPVLVTRYAWPVHYVVGIPFLSLAFASPRGTSPRRAGTVFAGAVVLFALAYLGTSPALRFPARAGVLALGTALALLLALRTARGGTPVRITP